MGVSNLALNARMQGGKFSLVLIYALGSFGSVMFLPAFFVTGIMFASCAVFIPVNEESTRKMLVDYLQNNKMY